MFTAGDLAGWPLSVVARSKNSCFLAVYLTIYLTGGRDPSARFSRAP